MKKSVIILETTRSAYSIDQILNNYTSMTVQELIDVLQQFPANAPVMFSNDNGYTYGHIYDQFIEERDVEINPSWANLNISDYYHIQGKVEDLVDMVDNPEDVFGDLSTTSKYTINCDVEILDLPDESGWVKVRIECFNGKEDIEAFVDVNVLTECRDW